MNDIGAGVNAKVLSLAAVKALVADRGYPDALPQKPTYPAYAYTIVSDTPEMHLLGEAGLSQARIQFDIYAKTRKESNAIAEAMRAGINGKNGAWGGETVRTCHLQNTFRSELQPIDGSDQWDYVTSCDYLVIYKQTTS